MRAIISFSFYLSVLLHWVLGAHALQLFRFLSNLFPSQSHWHLLVRTKDYVTCGTADTKDKLDGNGAGEGWSIIQQGSGIFVAKRGTAPCSAAEARPPTEERDPQPQMPPVPAFLLGRPSGLTPEYHPLCPSLISTSVQPIFANNFYILGILDMKINNSSSCL